MKRWKRFMGLAGLFIVMASLIAAGCSLMGQERSSPNAPTEQGE